MTQEEGRERLRHLDWKQESRHCFHGADQEEWISPEGERMSLGWAMKLLKQNPFRDEAARNATIRRA